MKQVTQAELDTALMEAALAGAREIKEFLGTYRGKDLERFKRAQIAGAAVTSYTRYRSSQNNLVALMMAAARQSGVTAQQTLDIAKVAGLLPDTAEAHEPRGALKAAK